MKDCNLVSVRPAYILDTYIHIILRHLFFFYLPNMMDNIHLYAIVSLSVYNIITIEITKDLIS